MSIEHFPDDDLLPSKPKSNAVLYAVLLLCGLIVGDIALTLNARGRGFTIIERLAQEQDMLRTMKEQLDRMEANQRSFIGTR